MNSNLIFVRSVKKNFSKVDGEYVINTDIPQTRGVVLDDVLSNTRSLYEWISPKIHAFVQPYFDLDNYAEGEEDYKATEKLLLGEFLEVLVSHYPQVKREQLRVSSYNGLTNDGKWKVSYHVVIHGYKCTVAQNKDVAKQLKENLDYVDLGVYRKAGLMRVAGHHKEVPNPNTRTPFLMYWNEKTNEFQNVHPANREVQHRSIIDFRYEHLINNVDEHAPMLIEHAEPAKPAEPADDVFYDVPTTEEHEKHAVEAPAPSESANDALLEKLNTLPKKYLNERGTWWYITSLLKALGEKSTWETWSAQSENYDKCNNEKQWNDITNAITPTEAEQRLNKKVLYETDLMMRVHEAVLDGTDEAMCQLFSHLWKHLWKVVSYPKEIHMFDDADQLWKQVPVERLNTFLTQHFSPLRTEYIRQLNATPEKFIAPCKSNATDNERKDHKKLLLKCVQSATASKITKVKNAFKVEFFNLPELQDPLFGKQLNANPDIISCLNGVVCLKTGKLRPRKYDDYLSKVLDIDYDPTQANPLFEKFMFDIFDHPELNASEIKTYMQVFLGYAMTGHNKAHKCVILHGNGSNGKSVFNDCIFKVLRCKFGKMVDSWDSKFMDDKGSKNENTNSPTPELAKLVDCNIGIINETSEDMCFGERYKKFNDSCEQLGYRQLHEKSKETRLITTFLMATNHFPNFPIKDCYIRRTEPIAMKVSFVANPTLPHQKLKDESLFQRMTETPALVQGILNWLIGGAKAWYANDEALYELPECAKKEKQKYIDGNDWTLLFVVGEKNGCVKNDVMWLSDVLNTINTNFSGLTLTNKTIIEKLTELGATAPRNTHPHTKKKEVLFRFIKDTNASEDAEEVVYQFSN